MIKYTQKQLKKLPSEGKAEDITRLSYEDGKRFREEHSYTVIGKSNGKYGCNGALLKDSNGKLFVITARNSLLMQLV